MRYRLITLAAITVVEMGCASRGARPEPFPRVSSSPASHAVPIATDRQALAATALSLRGSPYQAGGYTPSGFDCSGFVHYVFGRHGIVLPRVALEQYSVGNGIDADDVEPGDLVFFTTTAPGPSHVGMAIGGGRFIHAPSERGEVRVERLDSRYWARRFLGARRVLQE